MRVRISIESTIASFIATSCILGVSSISFAATTPGSASNVAIVTPLCQPVVDDLKECKIDLSTATTKLHQLEIDLKRCNVENGELRNQNAALQASVATCEDALNACSDSRQTCEDARLACSSDSASCAEEKRVLEGQLLTLQAESNARGAFLAACRINNQDLSEKLVRAQTHIAELQAQPDLLQLPDELKTAYNMRSCNRLASLAKRTHRDFSRQSKAAKNCRKMNNANLALIQYLQSLGANIEVVKKFKK